MEDISKQMKNVNVYEQNFAFEIPNKSIFADSQSFWHQGIVNTFMTENWFQNDPNYHYNLRVAITVQDCLVELRDLLAAKRDTIKQLQKINDPRLTLADFEEENMLQKQI